jgi:hypothetical protein
VLDADFELQPLSVTPVRTNALTVKTIRRRKRALDGRPALMGEFPRTIPTKLLGTIPKSKWERIGFHRDFDPQYRPTT